MIDSDKKYIPQISEEIKKCKDKFLNSTESYRDKVDYNENDLIKIFEIMKNYNESAEIYNFNKNIGFQYNLYSRFKNIHVSLNNIIYITVNNNKNIMFNANVILMDENDYDHPLCIISDCPNKNIDFEQIGITAFSYLSTRKLNIDLVHNGNIILYYQISEDTVDVPRPIINLTSDNDKKKYDGIEYYPRIVCKSFESDFNPYLLSTGIKCKFTCIDNTIIKSCSCNKIKLDVKEYSLNYNKQLALEKIHNKNVFIDKEDYILKTDKKILIDLFHYKNWIDRDSANIDDILNLCEIIRPKADIKNGKLFKNYPVIHCIAGIGRSCTLATIFWMREKIYNDNKIKFYDVICWITFVLRKYRRHKKIFAVQTFKQFVFIYNVYNFLISSSI